MCVCRKDASLNTFFVTETEQNTAAALWAFRFSWLSLFCSNKPCNHRHVPERSPYNWKSVFTEPQWKLATIFCCAWKQRHQLLRQRKITTRSSIWIMIISFNSFFRLSASSVMFILWNPGCVLNAAVFHVELHSSLASNPVSSLWNRDRVASFRPSLASVDRCFPH